MTAVEDTTAVGTSFPGSRKTYLQGSRPDLQVPMREVELTTGDRVVLYDTSGPYTDPSLRTDVRLGLPKLRSTWIAERPSNSGWIKGCWMVTVPSNARASPQVSR